ncbi:MAG: hypothetical protein Q9184_001255 [Pyrenodesmia sp. 2 TL-2023]
MPKLPKAPKYNGGSSSTGNYYYDPYYPNPYQPPHGNSGTYVSAAIPSMKNPLSFLNMRSDRKPLAKQDANISASKEGVRDGMQHYLRQVEATSIVNPTMANSTTLAVSPTNCTLPASWQGMIKEGDIAGYASLILFSLLFSILCSIIESAGKAYLGSPKPVKRIGAAKETAGGESVPYTKAAGLRLQKKMGYEKASLAEDRRTDVIDSTSTGKRPVTDSLAARYGWVALNTLLLCLEVPLWTAVASCIPQKAFPNSGQRCDTFG